MSNNTGTWILDEARRQYYYFSYEERCYVYANGLRIPFESQSAAAIDDSQSPTGYDATDE